MKRFALAFCFLLVAACACWAADIKYGSLNIFTKDPAANIYVDGEKKGLGTAQVKQIQAGTHFILVTTGEAGSEIASLSDVVDVDAGEVTTIYIDEHGSVSGLNKTVEQTEPVDVFKVKKVLDYSKEMHTGWYAKLGYLTNLYYNHDTPNLDNYAASFDIGLGFRIPLSPGIDFSLEMERGQFSTSSSSWYLMPITANIQLSFQPSPYFRGKQYYGLGIGYYITDLENQFKQNLTALGYHLFYGIEMPASDQSAYFFEFGYHAADISRYDYMMNSAYASAGFRWDVLK